MRQYFFKFFTILKKIAQKRFMYFVAAVVILVILADNYSEAHKRKLSVREIAPASRAEKEPVLEESNDDSKADSLVEFALSLEGVPYVYAGKNPEGFDCSGFIYYVYQRFGVEVPAGSANQYLIGEPIQETEIRKGDLVFFTGTQKGDRSVGHVGIVISDESAQQVEFVHSSSGGGGRGVTVNALDHPHYNARFLGARRVLDAS